MRKSNAITLVVLGVVVLLCGVYLVSGRGDPMTTEEPPMGRSTPDAGTHAPMLAGTPRNGTRELRLPAENATRAPPGFFVDGFVEVEGSGEPVIGVELEFRRTDDADGIVVGSRVSTDRTGRFRSETPLEPGTLLIQAPELSALVPAGSNRPGPVTLARVDIVDADVRGLRVPYPWSGSIAGQVLGPDERPLHGAEVGATLDSISISDLHHLARASRTDDEGRFQLSGLPTYRALVVVARSAGLASAASPPVMASPYQPPLTLRLSAGTVVSGQVRREEDGTPCANAWIALLRQERGTGGNKAITEADGTYKFSAVPPGRYTLEAFLQPSNRFLGRREVVLQEGKPVTVNFTAPGSTEPMIRGVVVDSTGVPWTHDPTSGPRWVRAQPRGDTATNLPPSFVGGMLQPDGRFEFSIPRWGQYRVSLTDVSGFLEAVATDVDMHERTGEIRIVRIAAAVTLRVRVRDAASGALLELADVLFATVDAEQQAAVLRQTDRRGEVSGPSVAPGTFSIHIGARGRAPEEARVEVRADESGDRWTEVRLGTGRRLQGRVVTSDRKPVAGATVAVVARSAYVYPSTGVVSGPDGNFTIDSLPNHGGQVGLVVAAYAAGVVVDADHAEVVLIDSRSR